MGQIWGFAKGTSILWVAKFKGDNNSECRLSNGRSRSYKGIKLLLSAGKWVVAKLQGDKSASLSSMELYCPWILDPSAFPENRQSPIASVQRMRSTLASHSAVPCGMNRQQRWGMEWWWMDSPTFRPWILEFQGLKCLRDSSSNQQNKGFYSIFQALKSKFQGPPHLLPSERTLNEWTPIARFESQHNERRVCEDSFL